VCYATYICILRSVTFNKAVYYHITHTANDNMFWASNTQATISQSYQPYLQVYICKERDSFYFTYPNLITFYVNIPWKILACIYWCFQLLYLRKKTSLNDGLYYRRFFVVPVTKSCQHTNEMSSFTNLETYTPAEHVLPLKGKLCSM